MELKFVKLSEEAVIPEYKTSGAAGMDVSSIEEVLLRPFERKIIKTGLSVEIPEGYEIQIRPRSGLSIKNGITLINCVGTIDSDYRGEIGIPLVNLSRSYYTIQKGERVAQLVVNKVEQAQIQIVEKLSETERGDGGFGSTGRN